MLSGWIDFEPMQLGNSTLVVVRSQVQGQDGPESWRRSSHAASTGILQLTTPLARH